MTTSDDAGRRTVFVLDGQGVTAHGHLAWSVVAEIAEGRFAPSSRLHLVSLLQAISLQCASTRPRTPACYHDDFEMPRRRGASLIRDLQLTVDYRDVAWPPAQSRGLTIFWSHSLPILIDWIEQTRQE
jgi:hypothetical protein